MRRLQGLAFGLMIVAAALLAFPVDAFACTAVYVGSELTDDGSYYFGRSEDEQGRYRKVFGVEQAKDHSGHEAYTNAAEGGSFTRPYPAHTYRYSYVRDTINYWEGYPHAFAAAGQNELGVSATAAVTTHYNEAAAYVDPLLDSGITEYILVSILLGEATNAREGCQLVGSIIDERGAGENFQFFISDGVETWLFAALSGHQWIAFKLPSDMVSVNPNMAQLPVNLDLESADVLKSDGLVQVAVDGGFARYFDEANATFDVFSSYGKQNPGANQNTRWMQGAYYFNSAYASSCVLGYDAEGLLADIAGSSLLFSPANTELTTFEVLRSLAFRGADTPFDGNAQDIYSIGNDTQAECHFFQVRPNMPQALKTIEWLCMGRAEYSLYLPSYSALITEVADVYDDRSIQHDTEDPLTTAASGALVYTFDDLNDLCSLDREAYGANVLKYLGNLQTEIIAQQKTLDARMVELYERDPVTAQKKATEIASRLATDIDEKAEQVLTELRSYIAQGDTSTPFLPSAMNADGTNKSPLIYAAYFDGLPISADPGFDVVAKNQNPNYLPYILVGGGIIIALIAVMGIVIFRKRLAEKAD